MLPRIKPPEALADLNCKAYRNGLTITEVLRRSGVAGSSWTDWKNGVTEPPQGKLDKIAATLDAMIAEDAAK